MPRKKNPHAVALGKLGGPKGGRARARNLTPERLSDIARMGGKAGGPARAKALSAAKRREIARKAAKARWGKSGKDT
jgi:general stress protein YciG